MTNRTFLSLSTLGCALLLWFGSDVQAAGKDLGGGFTDHGVATTVSTHRGTVATKDGEGRDVVLQWLYDHRGTYALLLIDAETGKAEQFPTPFPWGGDAPFASVLSSRNRFYSHFGTHFVEFDPVQRKYTFFQKTVPNMAMSMTEDDKGVIWSATYPSSGVASYNPETGAFRDYGHLYKQNWRQYPRSIAVDDTGWVYFGVGSTSGQIIALDPVSGKATPLIAEAERVQGSGNVVRDVNGKVYGSHAGTGPVDGTVPGPATRSRPGTHHQGEADYRQQSGPLPPAVPQRQGAGGLRPHRSETDRAGSQIR